MKQIKFISVMLLLATMCLGFNACSDDDDNGKDSIVGKWYVTDVYYQGVWIPAEEAGYEGAYAKFDSDLKYEGHPNSETTYNGTYERNGNVITCNVGGDTVTYTIIEQNGNNITAELNEFGTKTKFKAERR